MILFFGNVGSGKGTQAELLAKTLHCPTLSSGEILRQHVEDQALQTALGTGKLIADEVLFSVMEPEIDKAASGEFILDGFPRTVNQVKWLFDKVKAGEIKLTDIFHLHVSKEEVMERLLKRQRHDDTKEAITQRIEEYQQKVIPAINYLKQAGYSVKDIDAHGSIEDVAKHIEEAFHASQNP